MDRASVFGEDFDVSGFTPEQPKMGASAEMVRQVSEDANFKSREASEAKRIRREPRRYRTGRNGQFNIKADPKVIAEFYRISDAQGWVLGKTLECAVEVLRQKISAAESHT